MTTGRLTPHHPSMRALTNTMKAVHVPCAHSGPLPVEFGAADFRGHEKRMLFDPWSGSPIDGSKARGFPNKHVRNRMLLQHSVGRQFTSVPYFPGETHAGSVFFFRMFGARSAPAWRSVPVDTPQGFQYTCTVKVTCPDSCPGIHRARSPPAPSGLGALPSDPCPARHVPVRKEPVS